MSAALVALVAIPVGWLLVPALASWAPGSATPLLEPGWRIVQMAVTVVAGVVVAVAVDWGFRVVPLLGLVPVVVALAAADIVTRRLPDRLVLPTIPGVMGLMAVVALAAGRPGWLGGAALGAVLLGGTLLVIHLVSPAGMGFGDVKFGIVVGAALGWVDPLLALWGLLAASVSGALVGGAVALVRRDRKTAIPFGPFLAAGALIALALGA